MRTSEVQFMNCSPFQAYGLVATLATVTLLLSFSIGCERKPPKITPSGCDSLEALAEVLVEVKESKDLERLLSLVYPKNDVVVDNKEMRDTWQFFLDWEDDFETEFRCLRVHELDNHALEFEYPEIDGRRLEPNATPTHWIGIYTWVPPEKVKQGEKEAHFQQTFPVAQLDGKWWVVGARFQDSPQHDVIRQQVESSLPQADKELSDVIGISLNRRELNQHEPNPRAFYYHPETGEVLKSPKGAWPLHEIFVNFITSDVWVMGLDNLPDGHYEIALRDTPLAGEICFERLVDCLEDAFSLEIAERPFDMQAYRITVPSTLPQDIWSTPDADHNLDDGSSTLTHSISCHLLKGFTFSQFEEWLEEKLGAPVVLDNAPSGVFTFDVLIGGVEEKELLELWLEEGGFTIDRYTTTEDAIVIRRSEEPSE